MELKRVEPLSAAKVLGILYAAIGLLAGALFSLFALLGAAIGGAGGEGGGAGLLMGVGAIVFFPLLYGIMGAIAGLVGSALYNLVAKTMGGIEVELA